jgi:hypothetical protein
MSAAKSSRRSASSFARKRAARARARGVVRSCWTGRGLLYVGVDAELVIDLDARTGLGVARTDADADIRLDIVSAAEGTKDAKATSGDIRRQAKTSTSDDGNDGGDDDEYCDDVVEIKG